MLYSTPSNRATASGVSAHTGHDHSAKSRPLRLLDPLRGRLRLSTRRRPADARNHSVTACPRGCGINIATARRSAPMETASRAESAGSKTLTGLFRRTLRAPACGRRTSLFIRERAGKPAALMSLALGRRCRPRAPAGAALASLAPALLTAVSSATRFTWSPANAGRRSALRIRSTRRAAR